MKILHWRNFDEVVRGLWSPESSRDPVGSDIRDWVNFKRSFIKSLVRRNLSADCNSGMQYWHLQSSFRAVGCLKKAVQWLPCTSESHAEDPIATMLAILSGVNSFSGKCVKVRDLKYFNSSLSLSFSLLRFCRSQEAVFTNSFILLILLII